MVIDSNNSELARLDQLYQRVCTDFANGVLSAADARTQVLNLSYTDAVGRIWRIDTERSGRHARFRSEIGGHTEPSEQDIPEQSHPDSAATTNAELARLDQSYQQICTSFANGELSAADARTQVRDLSYTDAVGGTWRIDTERSGHHARFLHEIDDQTAPTDTDHTFTIHTAPQIRPVASRVAGLPDPLARTSRFRYPRPQTGRFLARVAATIAAVTVLVVGLNFVITTASRALFGPPTVQTSLPALSNPTEITLPTGNTLSSLPPTSIPISTRENIPFNVDIEFGRSVLGEPLIVHRRGVADGVRVLVVGVIHGDEDVGLEIVNILRTIELDTDIDLWLVQSMNPDGEAAGTRQNANEVDLNRNFPRRWEPLGEPGFWQYAGLSAGSEPEVQAMIRVAKIVTPQIVIWYHQDYFRISPTTGREGKIRARYATLVDLPLLPIEGGSYTGTAGIWTKSVVPPDGVTFVVEFGKSLRPGEAQANADALLTIAKEFFQKP